MHIWTFKKAAVKKYTIKATEENQAQKQHICHKSHIEVINEKKARSKVHLILVYMRNFLIVLKCLWPLKVYWKYIWCKTEMGNKIITQRKNAALQLENQAGAAEPQNLYFPGFQVITGKHFHVFVDYYSFSLRKTVHAFYIGHFTLADRDLITYLHIWVLSG